MTNNSKKIAILLVNLGTPDEPTPSAVSRYLKQFLSDTRVIEIPMFIWKIILNLFVLPIRSKKVAHAYESIWGIGAQEGEAADSPIRHIVNQQVQALQNRVDSLFLQGNVSVHPVMTYGNPGIPAVLDELQDQGVDNFVVLPLFPQYSSTSTGAVYDAIGNWAKARRELPSISIIKDYHDHPLYIKALAKSVSQFQSNQEQTGGNAKPNKLLMSFHGIPKPYEDKGDLYPTRCRKTAQLLADELGLTEDEWLCSFQSRFGLQEWVKPYTDETLTEWGEAGIESVQIISPAFSADCLETLEELAVENRDVFMEAGGKHYAYIPALNGDDTHIDLIEALTVPVVKGWQDIEG